ncbi:unnamed protein product [Hermetia illucens]|uniref:cystathionine gamma-lyase n=1 Tax=Hermetia illucens TaxID=343691 RepID=A0A7R8V3Z3_HERIL|nr:putative cystathionine gamma-lyase 2 [Hermetia illucens]CAD7091240.1 unnamed protein product [Hermetia illucens]
MEEPPRFRQRSKGFATKALHTGQDPEQWKSRCIVAPIITSTTFEQPSLDKFGEFINGREGNPTRNVLEKCLAHLDAGEHCVTFSSGTGAVMAVVSMLKPKDHLVCSSDLYGGTTYLLRKHCEHYEIGLDTVDPTELDQLQKAIKKNTKMVFIETPTNPLIKVLDIAAISKILKTFDSQNIIFVVDNTLLTPYFQRPLDLGVDIVVYSLTKYMNGHTDVTMGAAITNCPKLEQKLKFAQVFSGIVPSPFDCYQVNRGIKTLAVRMEGHAKNSLMVARFLESHPLVERVLHPGLPSHPQHKLAIRQSFGHSGIMSFYLKGNKDNTAKFMKALKYFLFASSFGGPESLISTPTTLSHAFLPAEEREKLGITDNLIRLSVGLEDADCLINDLDQALKLSQR